ncbi:MAG: C40 family peptidase [Ramlibacter sp.]|nr:C40 family peptidase [Ramlibacter sp.]
MSRWLCILLLVCASAHAAPGAPAEDDMAQFMADKGLLTRLGEVRHNVTDRASDLVVTAMGFLGVPYRRGGNSAETGFDCSGFVRAMYEQTIGLLLPRRANEQAAATETIDKKDLQPGDLVFFNTMRRAFSHVGIYVGNGKFIHSPRPGAEVRVENMDMSYWSRRFDGARRVLVGGAPAQEPNQAQASR